MSDDWGNKFFDSLAMTDHDRAKQLAPEGATHYIVTTTYGDKLPSPIFLKKARWRKWYIWFDSAGWERATIGNQKAIKRLK